MRTSQPIGNLDDFRPDEANEDVLRLLAELYAHDYMGQPEKVQDIFNDVSDPHEGPRRVQIYMSEIYAFVNERIRDVSIAKFRNDVFGKPSEKNAYRDSAASFHMRLSGLFYLRGEMRSLKDVLNTTLDTSRDVTPLYIEYSPARPS